MRCAAAGRVEAATVKVFTCNDFAGYWPVGTAAVIVAESEQAAMQALCDRLATMNLAGKQGGVNPTLNELPLTRPQVRILNDGDY